MRLKKRGPNYSEELKARVMAQLLAGDAVIYVARQHGRDKRLVSQWKKKAFKFLRSNLSGSHLQLSKFRL